MSVATATTSEGDGKNTEGESKSTGTQTVTEGAKIATQDDLDRLAAKVRAEERDKAERLKAKEDREREEAKAKEQGEYQQLADRYKAELDDAKPKLESLDRYVEAVKGLAETELKALPEEVRDMAPSVDNPLDVLAWLPKGKKLAGKLTGEAKPGMGRDPKPAGSVTPEEAVQQNKQAMRGRYAF
jgi:multidrug efflux pump subunit AcrA (membrane-fusion protein)